MTDLRAAFREVREALGFWDLKSHAALARIESEVARYIVTPEEYQDVRSALAAAESVIARLEARVEVELDLRKAAYERIAQLEGIS